MKMPQDALGSRPDYDGMILIFVLPLLFLTRQNPFL